VPVTAPIHVVAGVLRDAQGRILLTERPHGKHLAGLWEFPGGKCEEGEAPVDALARELREEIGVTVESARPLIGIPHAYPDKLILLDVWQITAWSGTPEPCEGQRLAWIEPDALDRVSMPPADRPVLTALRLPDRYLITPALAPTDSDALMHGIERACRKGVRLIQLRLPGWPLDLLARAARSARNLCQTYGTQLLVNADWRLAGVLGLDGVHLPARIAATLVQRPLSASRLVGVSCHDEADLAHAERIGADFATLSPIHETPDHPQSIPLGWDAFEDLVLKTTLPVYALGGLESDDTTAAQMAGGQGIAAIRGLWPT
jgi:8-oxo-dGTP diphosphatase